MPLRVAVQMDPMERINIAGDSTFAIMLGAQARGHRLWHYEAGDLSYRDGRLRTPGASGHGAAQRQATISLRRAGRRSISPSDVDVVLMRQDPPFDLAYITATHLLERIQDETLVVNDPAAVRNAPEKLFVLDFAHFMPPTLITRRLEEARAFHAEHGEVVVKPLYGNAGSAVFHVGSNDANLAALTELFGQVWREPFMVQAFLPAGRQRRQTDRAGRRQGGGRDQPLPRERRDPIQPRRGRPRRADRADRARAGDLRGARPGAGTRAACCSSAST